MRSGPPRCFAGGVAVIRVGGATEVEVKERKDRVDDAMHATRAAVEEGVLPGGGVPLLRAIRALDKIKTDNEDQKHGVEIVRKALSWPARQIVINAGEDGSWWSARSWRKTITVSASTLRTVTTSNLMAKGIIDPTKVVRIALQDAASIAGLLDHHRGDGRRAAEEATPAPAMPPGGMDY